MPRPQQSHRVVPTGPGCGIGPNGQPQSFAAEMLTIDRDFLGSYCEDCSADHGDADDDEGDLHAVLPVRP